jgi:hypothetical protein
MIRSLSFSLCVALFAVRCAVADDVHEVSRESVSVPMRDGVKLATDIYRNPTVERAAVLLMRTPYNKDRAKSSAERYASAGYIALFRIAAGVLNPRVISFPTTTKDRMDTTRSSGWENSHGATGGSECGARRMWEQHNGRPPSRNRGVGDDCDDGNLE